MIKHGSLTSAERSVVSQWNLSESDFEVFFGKVRDFDHDDARKDESGSACMLRLDATTLAVCFPIRGSTIRKEEAEALASSLTGWAVTR